MTKVLTVRTHCYPFGIVRMGLHVRRGHDGLSLYAYSYLSTQALGESSAIYSISLAAPEQLPHLPS